MRKTILVAIVLAIAAPASPGAQRGTSSGRPQPRLVVLLTVDQMRSDYVEWYSHQWTGGLHRLVTGGARFVEAAYPYLNTVTCPGHATISTGVFPRTHGIVHNSWWDRARSTSVACMSDSETTALPHNVPEEQSAGFSPGDLRAPTFADELRSQAVMPPRIVSVAVKARAVIALAGQRGDAVLWMDRGGLTTSTAYVTSRVPFVEAFVARHALASELGQDWTRLLPAEAYVDRDDGVGEHPPDAWSSVFPHAIASLPDAGRRASLWTASPLVDEYLGRFVEAAVVSLELGRRDTTDFLAMSFSSLDSVGHAFGPRSHEVQDALARIDRTLGRLLATLDERVGSGNYVVALSADHGVSPLPEQMIALGIDAGRLSARAVTETINRTLALRLGPGEHVSSVAYTDVYFAPGVYAKIQADPAAWRDLDEALRATPGIERILRREDLAATTATDDPVLRAARLSYFSDRSGDIVLVPRPYWILSGAGTTHGTLHGYDTRVPVVFYGAGVRAGRYWDAATPADVAPTLAALAGVTMARAEGRVLSAAFEETTSLHLLEGSGEADHAKGRRLLHPPHDDDHGRAR